MNRVAVEKTLKLYLGGRFTRSESGRVLPAAGAEGRPVQVSRASRKDLRHAITAARAALTDWSGRSAYNRGQILYRLAEMLESRATTLPTAEADALAAIDRAVHHAGWSDKISALLSSINPVAGAYVNYSLIRPLGVVAAFPDPRDGLLGLVEATAAPLVMGDVVSLILPPELGALGAAYSEALAVSDVPGGAVNLLTGRIDELLPVVCRHDDIDGLVHCGQALSAAQIEEAEREAAHMMRRRIPLPRAAQPAGPPELASLAEVQTVWMSQGASITQAGGY